MRIARVIGSVTLGGRLPEFKAGTYLIADALDEGALRRLPEATGRDKPMPESLVVFDRLGAGVGQLIAVSEGAEATAPFGKERVPVDAYCAAILDVVEVTDRHNHQDIKNTKKS
ncbi:MAG: hypothetical protein IT442_10355 [Phycisphaeraceae bacterium]|nr:hypothetical protein [Phycisphaeraceae bacterium]